jgi:cyclophilin family peptidyl-prolyl cis-trans isomerase/HEAT repeat protein
MKKILYACFVITVFLLTSTYAQIPVNTLVQISKAEDELRFDKTLEDLIKNANAEIRARAALAAGRIGNETAISALVNLLENDKIEKVRATAAFALGEIESVRAADAVLRGLQNSKNTDAVRGRLTEAAGKIAAANAKDEKAKTLGEAILDVLDAEDKRGGKMQSKQIVLLGITAALRARPAETDFVVAKFLTNLDARVRADAANTLSRIRAKNANEAFRTMLLSDNDAIARANAARALGAAEDKEAFNLLLEAATTDDDSRVRVSAIRSLASLNNKEAADKLLERGEKLLADYKKSKFANPVEKNELLEIATALGNVLGKTKNGKTLIFLDRLIEADKLQSAEIPIARMKISQAKFDSKSYSNLIIDESNLSVGRTLFQLFGEVFNFDEAENKFRKETVDFLRDILKEIVENEPTEKTIIPALPDLLNSFAKFKTDDLNAVLLNYINHKDVFIRTTAAQLLGEQPATKENIEALKTAFAESLKTDSQYDDAQQAILSTLVKLDKQQAIESLKLALDAPNHLLRRHAANLIRQNELEKDFPNFEQKVGTVKPYNPKNRTKIGQVLNTNADYTRAVSRKNGTVKAVLTTEKGAFTIDLTPEDAPLTVDNFIKLAKSNYFNGVAVHRVVPNFVMQDGDPLGNGSGGPGWSIRCEINMLEYERGAVGMALSGKDTGGSQWFVTHSPQPHLDGGYTIFGKVNENDMKVVDSIVRGDKILSVKIVEISAARSKESSGKK